MESVSVVFSNGTARRMTNEKMAVDAVSCELFSSPNSLLTGKNTGNFVSSVEAILR
jgi:hypothetical protein